MAERELADEVVSESYFKKPSEFVRKPSEDESPLDEGKRVLAPLYPFVISGGQNTERFYFKHISDLTSYTFNIRPQYFSGESNYTEVFSNRIVEILKNNTDAKIFCVFDWDCIYNDDTPEKVLLEKHRSFLKRFHSEITDGIVTICPTMPSIEYWFLLHFINFTDLLKNYSQVSGRLAPYIKSCFPDPSKGLKKLLKSEKYLDDPTWVMNLYTDGKLEDAIQRAEENVRRFEAEGSLDKHSYSYVYKAFIEAGKRRMGER